MNLAPLSLSSGVVAMPLALTSLDLGILGGYFLLIAAIGFAVARSVKNDRDFFSGGNRVSWFMGGVSNYMTMMSTFVFVAYAGVAYQYGVTAMVILWSAAAATLIGTYVFAPKWKRLNLASPVECLETRYNETVRQTVSWGGTGFRLLDNMVRLYAASVFISAITNFSMTQSIYLIGVVVVFYTMVGGLWAVVLTDTIQCVILVLMTMILVPASYFAAGGWSGILAARPEHWTCHGPKGSLLFLGVYYLMVLIKFNGSWAFIQRFYSTPSEKEARTLGLFSSLLFLVLPLVFLFPAMAASAIVPGLENPEEAYVVVCQKLLPAGTMGLLAAAMLAATMSTLSAEYNVTASVLTRDIYTGFFRPNADGREQLRVGRFMTFCVGIFVMAGASLVERFGGAFEANKILTGLFGVPLVVPLLAGVLWKKPTPASAMASLVVGLGSGLAFFFLSVAWEWATLTQILLSFLTIWAFPLVWPKTSPEYLAKVKRMFVTMKTPSEEAASEESTPTDRRMEHIFAGSLVGVGILFLLSGGVNYSCASGQMTIAAGVFCILFAIWKEYRIKFKTPNEVSHE